jgi:hypothetical protein
MLQFKLMENMPPRKRRINSCSIAESKGSDAEEASPLQDLPLPAQSLVYKHLDTTTRNALLRSSRWGRDLVLREVKAIRLILWDIDKAAGRKPLLGLLGKALATASSGLSVALMSTSEVTNSQYVSSCDEFVFHHILTIRVCRVLYTDASKRFPLRVGVRYA